MSDSRPVAPSIVPSSTFAFGSTAEVEAYLADPGSRYFYSRYANPTTDACGAAIAALEGAEEALLFSSGMGAISTTILSHVSSGDQILSMRSVYGGTARLFTEMLPRFGVRVGWYAGAEAARAIAAAPPETKLVYLESPTNPTLEIVDLSAAARAARERGILTVIDGTFASPANQNPLALGIDIVVHSATKSLGGHNDLLAGVAASSAKLLDPVHRAMKVLGTNLDPFAAFLLHRGLRTLSLRVERQNATALRLAAHCEDRPGVRRVLYPGLPSHPGHEVARRQMRGFGGIVTLDLAGGFEAARRVADRLSRFLNAPSLGGVDSLASIPILTSHYGLSAEDLARAGVTPGMLRLSVGIEPEDELIADLDQALAAE